MAKDDDRPGEMLEEGDIFFLYRPDVEEDSPSQLSDVQRFHLVLRPKGGGKVRLLVLGRKRMPDVEGHERAWGFVDKVAGSGKELERELREADYGTKSRGTRHQPAARPAGEGVYAVTLEDGQMHLAYSLELPQRPGQVQAAFGIKPEASYVLSVKNPEAGQPRTAGLREHEADYPKRLQEAFRGRRFASEDVRLLDREGAEFILIGARTNPQQAYGIEMRPEKEDYEHAEIIRRLRMARSRHPVEPLFEGTWE
jgi:hypothetical protein